MSQDLSFSLLFEMANDAIFVADSKSGCILQANEHAAEYIGLPSAELTGARFADLFVSTSQMEIQAWLEDEPSETTRRTKVLLKGRDGASIPCELTARLAAQDGVPVQVFVLRNFAERQQAQEDIHLRNEAIASVGSGVTITDARLPDRPLIYVNRGFEQTTGFSAEEALGRNCRFLQGEDRDQEGLEPLRQALADGRPCQVRLRNYRKDGSLFWNELHVSPVHDSEGELTHFVGIQIDVTDRVLDRQRLEASEKLKTSFIRMVSHEFRTPMTGIRASAAFLQAYGQAVTPEKRERHFLNIETGLNRMNRLLEDVLFASRSDAGKIPFEPEPVNLPAFCEHLVEELLTIHSDRCVEFTTPLPPKSTFLLDTSLLNQILHNLLANAIKYSPSDTTVHFHAKTHNGRLLLVVEDSGIGIPEEDLEHLFEPFHRASNVGAAKGTGLGLYIAKQSAELHSGSLNFSSTTGKGSRFEVNLPATIPPASVP